MNPIQYHWYLTNIVDTDQWPDANSCSWVNSFKFQGWNMIDLIYFSYFMNNTYHYQDALNDSLVYHAH